ncbi:neprilysin-2-like isoform X2 [Leptopilina heterotoma]|uniref:neprilysin-2-like isoform X2 n=1 Tax=Leptopilina heterotoma TaxID=63436 RepID=UPI001CA7C12A|nr:neprilysin-2-like isoform X2 [Leptopilina heterotoma]
MLHGEQKNFNGWRKQVALKLGLTMMMCLASTVNLSAAQNSTSQINSNNLFPHPLVNSVNEMKVGVSKTLKDETDYCSEPECVHTASRVLKYLDTSTDPCDNFYKFACGQYIQSQINFGPRFHMKSDILATSSKIQEQIKLILKQEVKPTEPKHEKVMKTLYQNCINTEIKNDKEILKLVVDSITKVDGWRYLENNSLEDTSFQWEDFDSKLEKELDIYETPFFKVHVGEDNIKNSNYFFHIHEPSNLEAVSNHLITLGNIFNECNQYGISNENVLNAIEKINKMLIDILEPENYGKLYNFDRMTIKELENNYSNIMWKKLFNTRLHPFNEVRDDDIVVISDISFFKKFNELINSVSKNDQAIYLIWRAIENIFIMNNGISEQVRGNNNNFCFQDLEKKFPVSLGALYVKNYYNETSNNKHIDEMFTNIFHQLQTAIENVDWLDNKTKDYALEKLASMYETRQEMFKIPNDKEFDEYYANLEITSGDFFESNRKVTKFKRNYQAGLFRLPFNRSNFMIEMNSAEMTAFYYPIFNTIGISPAMLQGNLFNANRPMYMNYGSAAFTLAHEYTHGLVGHGRRFDKNGYFVDWWQPTSIEQFFPKEQCFISQYGNYTDEEVQMRVNGTQTLNENIADDGLKIAYLAYQKWVEDHGPELSLPGINYTQPQLFWISFAQFWCEYVSPEYKKKLFLMDKHSPNEFRVLGSIANRPEFARDFQCPIGSKMNPETKCSFW